MEPPTIDMEELPFVVFYQCRMCTHLFFDDIEKMFDHLYQNHGHMIDCEELKSMVYTNGLRLGPPPSGSTITTEEELDLQSSYNKIGEGETDEIDDGDHSAMIVIPDIIHGQNGDADFDEENEMYEEAVYDETCEETVQDVKYHFKVHDDDEEQLAAEGEFDEAATQVIGENDELYDSNEDTQNQEEDLETIPQGYNYDEGDDGEDYGDAQVYEEGEEFGEEEEPEDDENGIYSGDDNGSQPQPGLLNYGYGCKYCGKFFTTRRGVESHEQHHKNQTTPASTRPTHGRVFPCKICKKKTFPSFKDLKQHVKTHTEERIHICKFCFSTFNNTASLTTHLKIHSRENPNKCFCGKTFVSANTLKIHKKIHTGVKPFVCKFFQCGRAFVTKSTLESHLRTHTGEKPYECGFCSSSFTTSSAKYRHERHVHKAHGPVTA